ncbi:MAG: ABC transporter permease, partial [Hymenobacteraceae bacterium]|nr:ABC transporter permease [Hymenobacteraceae bacterium]MDX5395690.1 ABC transporter permease [Hymenobacteraceae bacterium]MDX5511744.1 ABC transporter permease [Hymenobacteraceae bacterium]
LFTLFSSQVGIEHKLLIYNSGSDWTYSDISGFGSSLVSWSWIKLYWAGWAFLFGLLVCLLWVRGKESGIMQRLKQAQSRYTSFSKKAAASGVFVTVLSGGFLFYNTNFLNHYQPKKELEAQHALYEKKFGKYVRSPHPVVTSTKLFIDIYPKQEKAKVKGYYQVKNKSKVEIDSIHLLTFPEIETRISFTKRGRLVLTDNKFGYNIYVLEKPLQPDDSLQVEFTLEYKQQGISHKGKSNTIVQNGSYFVHSPSQSMSDKRWLPLIGYQRSMELDNAGLRKQHQLPPRPAVRMLADLPARSDLNGREKVSFEAVISTDPEQTVVAAGNLQKTWKAGGRRFFHYTSNAPIRNSFAFFSAKYAVQEAYWNKVKIQIFYHPDHKNNIDRLVKSTQASLEYNTKHFGLYPYRQIRFVEAPGSPGQMLLHSDPTTISYSEGFALLKPENDIRGFDFPFAVAAHEVAHQWWGNMLVPAYVEGAPLLTESLAWYSSMMVVKQTYGNEHLNRLLRMMRQEFLTPRSSASEPLIKATNHFQVYRKGPFAMYALQEYI